MTPPEHLPATLKPGQLATAADTHLVPALIAAAIRRAVVFHHKGNWPSKHLNERFGGRYWRAQPMQWADGQTATGHGDGFANCLFERVGIDRLEKSARQPCS
jgi:hypothetical protein